MAELADASDLGSDGLSCAGSSPVTRTSGERAAANPVSGLREAGYFSVQRKTIHEPICSGNDLPHV